MARMESSDSMRIEYKVQTPWLRDRYRSGITVALAIGFLAVVVFNGTKIHPAIYWVALILGSLLMLIIVAKIAWNSISAMTVYGHFQITDALIMVNDSISQKELIRVPYSSACNVQVGNMPGGPQSASNVPVYLVVKVESGFNEIYLFTMVYDGKDITANINGKSVRYMSDNISYMDIAKEINSPAQYMSANEIEKQNLRLYLLYMGAACKLTSELRNILNVRCDNVRK